MYVGLSSCGCWYVHALIIVMIIIIVLKILIIMIIDNNINNNDKRAYNNIAIKYCNSYLLVYMYLFIIEIVNLNTKVPFYYTYRLVCKCSLGNSLGGSYVMLTRLILELVYFKCLITRFYTVYQLHQG